MKAKDWLFVVAVAAIFLLPLPLLYVGVPVGVVLGVWFAVGLVVGIRFMLVETSTLLRNSYWLTFIVYLIAMSIDSLRDISYDTHHSAGQLIWLAFTATGVSSTGVLLPAAARTIARRAIQNPSYGVLLVAAPVLGFVLKEISALPLLPGILFGAIAGLRFPLKDFFEKPAVSKHADVFIIMEWLFLGIIAVEAITFSTESRSLTAAGSAFLAMYVTDTVIRKVRQRRAGKLAVPA